jgi:hypothetical protein
MILPFHHSTTVLLQQETMELFVFGTMVIENNFIVENLLLKVKPHQLIGYLFPKETAVECLLSVFRME